MERSTVFEPVGLGVQPPTHIGFCAESPCQPEWGTDCCCWSDAAVELHPAYPNPDLAAFNRSCDTPPALLAGGFMYFKEPGYVGNSGRLEALEAVAPVYDNRDLCCAYPSDDIAAESRMPPSSHVVPLPPATTWNPPPLPTTTPAPTADPFLAQDELAASLEKSAADYKDAAMSIHDTASSLESALHSVKVQAEHTLAKKKINNQLRAIITGYVHSAEAGVDGLHMQAEATATAQENAAAQPIM